MVPGGPSVRRPITAPSASPARPGSTAASRPPEVIASHNSQRSASPTPGAKRVNVSAWDRLRRAVHRHHLGALAQQVERARDRGDRLSLDLGRETAGGESSCRWPSSPKPVTSVIAWAPAPLAASSARRLSSTSPRRPLRARHPRGRAWARSPSRRRRGAWRARARPGPAAGVGDHLAGMNQAGDRETVLRLGVRRSNDRRRSRPRRPARASRAALRGCGSSTSPAAGPRVRRRRGSGRCTGRAAHRVDVGEIALVAAIRPKSNGSSTIGVKKSTVCTSARSSPRR